VRFPLHAKPRRRNGPSCSFADGGARYPTAALEPLEQSYAKHAPTKISIKLKTFLSGEGGHLKFPTSPDLGKRRCSSLPN